MGSDLGPAELLRGVVSAASHYDAELCAVGQSEELNRIAKEQSIDLSGISILDAPDVITMEDKPMSVIREKNHSSMANGLRALSHGEADAFVSAGNTGALIAGGTMIVRRIRGVMRAAIGTLFPFSAPVLLLDSGANLRDRISPRRFAQQRHRGDQGQSTPDRHLSTSEIHGRHQFRR